MASAEFERADYESRLDLSADDIQSFVAAVLGSIDEASARTSPSAWQEVCRFFKGCTRAARAQGTTPRAGGRRIVAYLSKEFPSHAEGSNDGFFEFMDWLSNPEAFKPAALRAALTKPPRPGEAEA